MSDLDWDKDPVGDDRYEHGRPPLVFGPRALRGMLERIPSVGRKVMAELVAELREANQEPRSLRAVS